MDWCATHFLPPPTPTLLKIYGYRVTRLDIAVAIGAFLIALAAVGWYGHWVWFGIALLLFAMMWIWMW
jgi:hypothetical protein